LNRNIIIIITWPRPDRIEIEDELAKTTIPVILTCVINPILESLTIQILKVKVILQRGRSVFFTELQLFQGRTPQTGQEFSIGDMLSEPHSSGV